jgi:hypothetical protein
LGLYAGSTSSSFSSGYSGLRWRSGVPLKGGTLPLHMGQPFSFRISMQLGFHYPETGKWGYSKLSQYSPIRF